MRKVYVEVVAKHTVEGKTIPLSITYHDHVYQVDKVLDSRLGVSLLVGGVGMKYTIRVLGQTTYLFEEEGKWFVEAKLPK